MLLVLATVIGNSHLRGDHEEQGKNDRADNKRTNNQAQGYAAGLQRGQFIGVVQYSQADHSGQEDKNRPQLINNEGNGQRKVLERQPGRICRRS